MLTRYRMQAKCAKASKEGMGVLSSPQKKSTGDVKDGVMTRHWPRFSILVKASQTGTSHKSACISSNLLR